MQVALDALLHEKSIPSSGRRPHLDTSIKLLREALSLCRCGQPPHPNFPCEEIAAFEWQSLTADDLWNNTAIMSLNGTKMGLGMDVLLEFAKEVEQALREKNDV